MDVNHIADMEDGLNNDEMEALFEGDADAGNNDQIAEDHAARVPIASDEHAIVQQQVGLRKKKSMYVIWAKDWKIASEKGLISLYMCLLFISICLFMYMWLDDDAY